MTQKRYRDSDFLQYTGINLLSSRLGFRPNNVGLTYDISTDASEVGDIFSFSAKFNAQKSSWKDIQQRNDFCIPTEATANEEWSEDFKWLVDDDACDTYKNTTISSSVLSVHFINSCKQDFQIVANETHFIYFEEFSDVNYWSVFWGDNDIVNFLAKSN